MLQCVEVCCSVSYISRCSCCSVLQCVGVCCSVSYISRCTGVRRHQGSRIHLEIEDTLQHTSTHCNTLQQDAPRNIITLQITATHCDTLQHTAARCNTLQKDMPRNISHATTHCNTLKHTAAHCNILQQDMPRIIWHCAGMSVKSSTCN